MRSRSSFDAPRHAAPVEPVGRRAVLAAAASALIPGSGQLVAGRRRSGLFLLGLSALAVAAMWWWLGRQSLTTLAAWLVRPATLGWLLAVNAVLFLGRLAVTVHAYRAARGHARPVSVAPLVVSIIVAGALLVAPHGAAAYVTVRSQAVLDAVFVAPAEATFERGADLVPGIPAVPDDAETERPAQERQVDDSGPPDDGVEPGGEDPGGDLGHVNPWIAEGRLTVAVLGSDLGPGRASGRTDAMLVVSVNAVTGETAVFSIDRYLRDFPVPDKLRSVYDDICARGGSWDYLNAVYTCATGRGADAFAELYPDAEDAAAQAVTDVLAELLDLPITHYAKVDMEGFVRAVDAIGGVPIELSAPITVRMSPAHEDTQWRVFEMPRGHQVMDGETALAYVRMRDPGDGPRMRRQRCLVSSMIEHTRVTDLLLGFGALTTAVERHVVTNIPIEALPDLIEIIARVDHRDFVGVGFGPPTYRGSDHVPDTTLIRQRVRQVFDDPQAVIETARTVEGADDACR